VSRWEPDARGRLERAALELFAEHGFVETTVPQITERAGLTTRTFFRHFTDKREVLFAAEEGIRAQLVELIREAPAGLSPIGLLTHCLERASAELFESRFDDVRRWRSVVDADESLRERALRKQQLTIEAAEEALRERGLDDSMSTLVARLAVDLQERAVGRWVAQRSERRELVTFVHEDIEGLRRLLDAPASPAATPSPERGRMSA
jgi:AcrR family transcriptional regulator